LEFIARYAQRKFFYLFTCEYCFSHYVTLFFVIVTRFTLLYDAWRGYLVAGFWLIWDCERVHGPRHKRRG
jgi:hypothetical protein